MSTKLLKNIAVAIEKKQKKLFTYPVKKQETYVAHFKEPKDGIERGYFQYRCQMKLYGMFLHILLNMAALPLSMAYLIRYSHTSNCFNYEVDAVFFDDGKPFNIIPDSVQQKYKDIITLSSDEKKLNKFDRKFLRTVFKRYPFSWMLWLKLIIKVAQYSSALTRYTPQAVISCSEFSYTSPILTEYCHARGVKLVNVMHGEKLYDMRDSFSKYDEFYVWSEEYAYLLCDLRADKKQFRIEIPQALRINKTCDVEVKYDYTYYLADENEVTLNKIAEELNRLYRAGRRISIRPHPRYSDLKLVNRHLGFANIENVRVVTIEQSLLQTKAAISLFSTVLNQASCNFIPIIIDDVSNPMFFEKLKELRYVCLNREHQLLSHITYGIDEKKEK